MEYPMICFNFGRPWKVSGYMCLAMLFRCPAPLLEVYFVPNILYLHLGTWSTKAIKEANLAFSIASCTVFIKNISGRRWVWWGIPFQRGSNKRLPPKGSPNLVVFFHICLWHNGGFCLPRLGFFPKKFGLVFPSIGLHALVLLHEIISIYIKNKLSKETWSLVFTKTTCSSI